MILKVRENRTFAITQYIAVVSFTNLQYQCDIFKRILYLNVNLCVYKVNK